MSEDIRLHERLVHRNGESRRITDSSDESIKDFPSSVPPKCDKKSGQYSIESYSQVKPEPRDYSQSGQYPHKDSGKEQSTCNRENPGMDDHDVVPCRSRRKRACPRHVEMEDQNKRCASTGSTSSSVSDDSQISGSSLPQTQYVDYSLLKSDRKRLLPLSQQMKVNQVDEHGVVCSSSDKPKATICYRPRDQNVNGQPCESTEANLADDKSPKASLRSDSGPLDLVLQGRYEMSKSPNDKTSSESSSQNPEDLSGLPSVKKVRLHMEDNNNINSCGQLQAPSRMGFPFSSQYEAFCSWSPNFYNLTQHPSTNTSVSILCFLLVHWFSNILFQK